MSKSSSDDSVPPVSVMGWAAAKYPRPCVPLIAPTVTVPDHTSVSVCAVVVPAPSVPLMVKIMRLLLEVQLVSLMSPLNLPLPMLHPMAAPVSAVVLFAV